jgi:hypothetical protein
MDGGGGRGGGRKPEGCALNENFNRPKPVACDFQSYPTRAPLYPFLTNLTRYLPDLSLPVVKLKWVLFHTQVRPIWVTTALETIHA